MCTICNTKKIKVGGLTLRLPEWEEKSAALAASAAALRKESVKLVPAANRGLGSPPRRELPCPATSDIPILRERSLTTNHVLFLALKNSLRREVS